MTQADTIANLLVDMKPGPEGQISQREVLRVLHKAYQAGYREGEYHGRVKELRLQAIPKEVLRI